MIKMSKGRDIEQLTQRWSTVHTIVKKLSSPTVGGYRMWLSLVERIVAFSAESTPMFLAYADLCDALRETSPSDDTVLLETCLHVPAKLDEVYSIVCHVAQTLCVLSAAADGPSVDAAWQAYDAAVARHDIYSNCGLQMLGLANEHDGNEISREILIAKLESMARAVRAYRNKG